MEAHHEYRVHAFGAGGRNGVVQAEGIQPTISSYHTKSGWPGWPSVST